MRCTPIRVALTIAVLSTAPAAAAAISLPSVPHYILVPQLPPEPLAAPRYIESNENFGAEPKPLGGQSEVAGPSVWQRLISPHESLIVLSSFLGLAILLLAGSTVLLWRMTRRSVHIAEQALIELERPFLHIAVTKPGLLITPGRSALSSSGRGVFEISVFNLGRTPATLTHLEYNLVLVDRGSIADPIDPQRIGGCELPAGTISALNHPYIANTEMRRLFDKEAQIRDGSLSVWLLGFVRYHDIFGNHYISGFAKIFDRTGKSFVARGDGEYNYTRNEMLNEIPVPFSSSEADRQSLAAPNEEIPASDAQLELAALPKLPRDSYLASC